VNDGYEGFIETSAFEITETTATHWVCTKATFVFEKPDIKGTVTRRLLFGSELTVDAANVDGKFVQLAGGGFVWKTHCLQKNSVLQSTMVETAHSNYQHTPYLWGGRSSDGCDCSGLVQMLAMATGVSLPRDSVDQEKALTENIEFQNRTAEDLVFWAGHVGVLMSLSEYSRWFTSGKVLARVKFPLVRSGVVRPVLHRCRWQVFLSPFEIPRFWIHWCQFQYICFFL